MIYLDSTELTAMQYLLVYRALQHPIILTKKQMRTANALERKGWGTVETGGMDEMIFRLNQDGLNAVM